MNFGIFNHQKWFDDIQLGIILMLGKYPENMDISLDIKNDIWWVSLGVIYEMIFGCKILAIMIFDTLIFENYAKYQKCWYLASILNLKLNIKDANIWLGY